jgi:hypothetical protein
MMIKYLALSAVMFTLVMTAQQTPAFAWCDKDCRDLCYATAGRGWSGTARSCINHFQCSQYAGRKCEPARVKAKARQYNAGK